MAGLDAVEGAIFALLGLLLAFAVSGALQRFDERRQLIVQEATAVSTAYDHLDLLEARFARRAEGQAEVLFRRRASSSTANRSASTCEGERAIFSRRRRPRIAALKAELWSGTLTACLTATYVSTCSILLPIDDPKVFETARCGSGANEKHPPTIVFAMLYGFGLVGSLLAGFSMAATETPSRVHLLAFALALSFALFVMTNVEFPRLGVIRVNSFDHFLTEAYAKMR